MRKETLYAVKNAGKMRRYQITKGRTSHWRHELVDGRIELVEYGMKSGARKVIDLVPSDASKFAHLGLLELSRNRVEVTETKPKTGGGATQVIDPKTGAPLEVPADWDKHSTPQIHAWAELINGKRVANAADAKAVVAAWIKEKADGQPDAD